MLIGVLGLFSLVTYSLWCDGASWPNFTPEEILVFSLAGFEGAITGAIGTLDGLRSGSRRLWPIAAFPSIMLLLPLLFFAGDQKSQGIGLLVGLVYGLFALIAGRVGQEIGVIGAARAIAKNSN
jgi:hypothetical protein